MPFDGTSFSENPALQKLDAVRELLATESQWCKGAFKTPDGRPWLVGAMQAAQARLLLEPIVLSAIRDVTGRSFWRIESFNDHRTTTHPLVLRVLNQARQRIVMGTCAAEPPRSRIATWLKSVAAKLSRPAQAGATAGRHSVASEAQSAPQQHWR